MYRTCHNSPPATTTALALLSEISEFLSMNQQGGGLATREFTTYMAGISEADARVLKQNRLLREELEAKAKKGKKGEGKGADGASTPA